MSKDDAFWNLVQEAAHERNCSFFIDCGEGREFETDDMKGEDLFGWLIPQNKKYEFSQEFREGNVSDKWSEFLVFAFWEENNGSIAIRFE